MESIEADVLTADQRCPCLLVLDTSGSMAGEPIDNLNQGLAALELELKKHRLASRRCEVAVLTFGDGGVELQQDFIVARNFAAPVLAADGQTPMGEAVRMAMRLLRNKKNEYRAKGTPYYRPWLMLFTDGEPTDTGWESAAQEVRQEELQRGVTCFPIGVGQQVNLQKLAQFSNKPPAILKGLEFENCFSWLGRSLEKVSASSPGEQIDLLPIDSWASLV